ncbi:hypothetical protein KBY27_17405 [Ruegeria pomeroyi]|uniref:Uncharacterized protein n=1 Tax=Ruegeria pomeroyi TaxID=89184 RepID=A0A9Q3ZPN7_9RHOB|nr:hypothetical protein [Ruegeria pomeroyi]
MGGKTTTGSTAMTYKRGTGKPVHSRLFPNRALPPTKKSRLPVTVIEATAFAFRPESLSERKREELDLLYHTNAYFRKRVDYLRKNLERFENMEFAP